MLELPGGCLCCAVREDLARTLRGSPRPARSRRGARRSAAIVIETSGLADPAPILYTLGADPMLDALPASRPGRDHGRQPSPAPRRSTAFAEAARQVAMADTMVISKTDLAPSAPNSTARLDALNAGAARVTGARGGGSGRAVVRRRRPHRGIPLPEETGCRAQPRHRHVLDRASAALSAGSISPGR